MKARYLEYLPWYSRLYIRLRGHRMIRVLNGCYVEGYLYRGRFYII